MGIMIGLVIICLTAFLAMAVYALYINNDWADEYGKLNKKWFEIATAHSNEWAKLCHKIADENNALKKRVEELEAKLAEKE